MKSTGSTRSSSTSTSGCARAISRSPRSTRAFPGARRLGVAIEETDASGSSPALDEFLGESRYEYRQGIGMSRRRAASIPRSSCTAVMTRAAEQAGRASWARALLCERGPAERPCGECSHCRRVSAASEDEGSFIPTSIMLDRDQKTVTSIDATRGFLKSAQMSPYESRGQVFRDYGEAETLGAEAADTLLKILEEPPPRTPRHFLSVCRPRTGSSHRPCAAVPWRSTSAAARSGMRNVSKCSPAS